MRRRAFLLAIGLPLLALEAAATDGVKVNKKFIFKIKTKSGGSVGNILIEAKDIFAAIVKLKKRYPGCEILEGHERS